MNKPLSLEGLQELAATLIPEFNSQDIDDFIAKGNKIEDVALVTSLESLKRLPKLRTKHGWVKVQYTTLLPNNFSYLVNVPDVFPYKGGFML